MIPQGLAADERGVSETVGAVLLLGITILGVGTVVAIGGSALDATQDRVAFDNAEISMTELDSRIGLVALGESETKRVTLPRSDRSSISVDEDAGEIRLHITNRSTGETMLDRNETLGAVTFTQDDRQLAYQGGGVWRTDASGHSTVVSPPEFHYRVRAGEDPTLTLPIVTVRGATTGNEFLVRDRGTERVHPGGELQNPLEDGRVEVTIQSDYYQAWGAHLERRTNGEVDYDHDEQTVRLTLVTPEEPRTLEEAIAAGGQNLILTGGSTVDAYNSSEGTYEPGDPCPADHSARVFVDDDLEVSGDTIVCGDMFVNGDLDIGGGITVRGQLLVDGDITFDGGSGTIDGIDDGIVATGTLYIPGGGVTLSSDTTVGQSVDIQGGGVTIDSTVVTGGEYLSNGENITADASIHADGDIEPVRWETTINGEVRTAGSFNGDKDDYGGTILDSEDGVESPDLSALDQVRTMRVPNLSPIDDELDDTIETLAADNDNEGADPAAFGQEECDDGDCILEAGDYHVESMNVGDLTIDTTDGAVRIAVEDDFHLSGSIDVVGDGNVEIYVGDDITVDGGSDLTTPGDRGDQVFIYGGSTSDVDISGASTVFGVIYTPGNEDVAITGGSELYGAVVGTISDLSGDSAVHYDNALSQRQAITESPDRAPRLAYIHVTVNEVEIED